MQQRLNDASKRPIQTHVRKAFHAIDALERISAPCDGPERDVRPGRPKTDTVAQNHTSGRAAVVLGQPD
jgi:hypothetical protein